MISLSRWTDWAEAPVPRLGGIPRWFAFLAGAALLLRGMLWWQSLGSPFSRSPIGDEQNYWLWAERIAAGAWAPQGAFYQGPLFPYLLGFLKSVVPTFGQHGLAGLQLLVNWMTCLLFLPLVGRRAGERTALAASSLALFFAPAAFFALKGSPATIGLLFLVLGLCFLPADGAKKLPRCALSGFFLGLMALAVPSFILAVGAAAAFLRPRHAGRARYLSVASLLGGFLLVVLPVAVSNFSSDRSLVLISSSSGVVFAHGNNPQAQGGFTAIPGVSPQVAEERRDAEALARREAGRALNAQEVSDHFFRKGLEFIAGQPFQWAALEGRKLALLASGLDVPHEFSLTRERRDFLPVLWAFPVSGTVVLLLASAGLLLPTARKDLSLFLLASLALGAICLIFYVGNRYAYPCHFLLLPAAAAGALGLRRLAGRPLRAAVLLPVAVSAIFAWPVLSRPDGEVRDYLQKLVLAYDRLGNEALVARTLEKMVRLAPDSPEVFYLIGWMYKGHGDLEYSLGALDRALMLDPGDGDTVILRSQVLDGLGRREEAESSLSGWLKERPGDTLARLVRIRYLEEMGRGGELDGEWQAALQGDPFSFEVRLGYARHLLGKGRVAEAEGELLRAALLDPASPDPHLLLADLRQKRGDAAGASEERAKARALTGRGEVAAP